MERYYKRKFPSISDGDGEETLPKRIPETMPKPIPKPTPNPSSSDGIDLGTLPWDPSERPSIFSYDTNIRDEIRRKYLSNGACQPRGGNDAFVTDGFNSWSKKYGLNNHVGEVNSYHNKALQKCEILLNQKQSIHVAFKKQSEGEAKDYGIRLNLSVETCIFLLKASLPFRGHDEKKDSLNKGIFLELYDLLANQNEETREKSRSDMSKKEQMALVLRYVDRLGIVKERFAGVVHVDDTSSVRGQGYDGSSNMRGKFN
ncbi:zinc finger MYM-type protein 1-like protein, partial [Tanacetum coccineum]